MNFVQPIVNHARTRAVANAIVDGDRQITYGELAKLIRFAAGHLKSGGIGPGDRVGVCLRDGWETIVTVLAVAYLGAAFVPMDWRARPIERSRVADALRLRLALVESDTPLAAQCQTIALDDAWRRSVAKAEPAEAAFDDWNAPFVINSTSGTTGVPKFTAASHLQNYLRAVNLPRLRQSSSRRRYLSSLPLYFGNGMTKCLGYLLHGDEVILQPALFTAGEFADAMNRHAITDAVVVPVTIRHLLQIAGGDGVLLPHAETIAVSGSPIFAEEKREAIAKVTPNLIEEYGTSAIGIVARLFPADLEHRPDSVGRIEPLVEAKIIDDRGDTAEPGATGRLCLRGPTMGALVPVPGDAAGPSEDFRAGWYYPGELASFDDEYYLYVKGRVSEVIMRGGAKIRPEEVESVLLAHADVVEAAVVGVPGPDNEETVVAFVTAARPLDANTLLGHCRARLTPYKTPREIHVVAELPRNTAGKINKIELVRRLKETPRR